MNSSINYLNRKHKKNNMKLFSSKKAQGEATEETMIPIFAMVIAIGIIMMQLLLAIDGLKEHTIFEKSFLERDIANTIDTIYASPGNIMIDYDEDTKWFSFKFDEDSVNAHEKIDILHPDNIVYYFTPDKKTTFSSIELDNEMQKLVNNRVCCKIRHIVADRPSASYTFEEKDKEDCEKNPSGIIVEPTKEHCPDLIQGLNLRFVKTDKRLQVNKKESLVPNMDALECNEVENAQIFSRSAFKRFDDITEINDSEGKNKAINDGNDVFVWYYPGSYDSSKNTIKAFISSDVNLEKNRRLACLILNQLLSKLRTASNENNLQDITGVAIIPTDSWQMLNQETYLSVLLEIGNKNIPEERNIWSNEEARNSVLESIDLGLENYG